MAKGHGRTVYGELAGNLQSTSQSKGRKTQEIGMTAKRKIEKRSLLVTCSKKKSLFVFLLWLLLNRDRGNSQTAANANSSIKKSPEQSTSEQEGEREQDWLAESTVKERLLESEEAKGTDGRAVSLFPLFQGCPHCWTEGGIGR